MAKPSPPCWLSLQQFPYFSLRPPSSDSSSSSSSSSSSQQPPPQAPPTAPLPPPLPTAMRRPPPTPGYIPPEEPTILEDEPPDDSGRAPAPYEVFLNRAPQPADSWLHIETMPTEYRLHARLPGFAREGITLATKRRRILHLVADKWDRDGGHFERRISFGHDADLVQVRAEFDGEMLRVSIPRRQPAWSNSRIAYSRA